MVFLVTAMFAMYAIAQAPSNNGSSQKDNQQSQNKDQQSSQQTEKQDASSNTNESNAQQDSKQDTRDSSNSQDQADRDNQGQKDHKTSSKQDSSAQSDRQDRQKSDSSRNEDRRDTTNNRSSRDANRNVENRSTRSDEGSSRERSSSDRSDMRGPDIGIWFNRSTRDGLVISDVSTKRAIAKLGFREGDRIVSVNGRRVTREEEFIDFLFHSDVDRIKVIVIRDGREETIVVEPAVLIREHENTEVDPLEQFGIVVDDRYDDRIIVWRVIPRSPAYYAGFRAGDVIIMFGDHRYRTRTEFEKSVGGWKSGEVNVQVRRADRTRDLSVDVPNFERSSERSARRDDRMVRSASGESDRGNVDRSERRDDNQSQNNRRGGILRGRGNR